MVDGAGVPLACLVSAANEHDVTALLAVVLAVPLRLTGAGDPLPARLLGDRAYGSAGHEAILSWLGVRPQLAQRGAAHGSGLGKERYVVERAIAAVHHNRRLKVRYEKRSDIHHAFLTLACIKLCFYRLREK
jgi:hypothetical protein